MFISSLNKIIMSINKDTIVAIFLLLFCGIMINSSFDIEDPGYQGMKASFWPTIVLCLLSVMSLVMLIKSMVSSTNNNLNYENVNSGKFYSYFLSILCYFCNCNYQLFVTSISFYLFFLSLFIITLLPLLFSKFKNFLLFSIRTRNIPIRFNPW